jgi:hypothetical protein
MAPYWGKGGILWLSYLLKVTLYDETLILSKNFLYIFILNNDIPLNSSNFFKRMLKSNGDIRGNAMATE